MIRRIGGVGFASACEAWRWGGVVRDAVGGAAPAQRRRLGGWRGAASSRACGRDMDRMDRMDRWDTEDGTPPARAGKMIQ